jgi:GNAT superfamily N-acetyltransferase
MPAEAATIRPYAESDRDTLRDLVGCLHESLRPLDPDLAPTGEIISAHVEELLRKVTETDGMIAFAEVGGDIVGYICLFGRTLPHDLDEVQTPFTCLAEIFVRPAWQGRRIGAALLAAAEAYARSLGAPKLELNVLAKNAEARRFYEREGYAERVVTLVKRFDGEGSHAPEA